MASIKTIRNNCRHATYLIEKGQHTPLSFTDRCFLFIHLSGCSICRLFRQQSRQINRALRELFHRRTSPTRPLDETFKRELQEKINQRLP